MKTRERKSCQLWRCPDVSRTCPLYCITFNNIHLEWSVIDDENSNVRISYNQIEMVTSWPAYIYVHTHIAQAFETYSLRRQITHVVSLLVIIKNSRRGFLTQDHTWPSKRHGFEFKSYNLKTFVGCLQEIWSDRFLNVCITFDIQKIFIQSLWDLKAPVIKSSWHSAFKFLVSELHHKAFELLG